jgi:hypothetical protein
VGGIPMPKTQGCPLVLTLMQANANVVFSTGCFIEYVLTQGEDAVERSSPSAPTWAAT